MPFDALNLSVIADELRQRLVGGKINKITQPEKDEIDLNVFNGKNYRLLVSASSSLPRAHLTDESKPSPLTAPAFCMVLRKHLMGGVVTGVSQQPFERVIIIDVTSGNELGDSEQKRLICEVVGKSANVFLTDGGGRILDCMKRIPMTSLAGRPTVIGQKFEFLTQDKIRPDDREAIIRVLRANPDSQPKEVLKNKLMGVAYQTLDEIVGDSARPEEVADRFALFAEKLKTPRPTMVTDEDGTPLDVTAVDYRTLAGGRIYFDTLNEAYDRYFAEKDKFQRHNEKTKAIANVVKNAIHRIEKKTALQTQDLLAAKDNEKNRIYGELILSSLYKIKKGDGRLTTENYYDGKTAEIPLDPLLTPQQNAQKYFKKYAKQKKTIEYTTQLLEENKSQLVYLKSIAQSLKSPLDANDIDDITAELIAARIMKKSDGKDKKQNKKQKPRVSKSRPLTYVKDGWTILVGKNNLQNDKLTFETAKGGDMWLHAQDVTSCHTIIINPDGADIPDAVLQTAAEITAHYSESSESSKVPVFYTPKKYVKKPNKSHPGFVNLLSYKTCLVNPDEHTELLRKEK